jgi:hypothetical protein
LSLSSITEHSFHGMHSLPEKGKSVTYVSGTICYLCLGSLTLFSIHATRRGLTLDTSDKAALDELNKLAWEQAKVTGTANGDTISVKSVAAVR